MKVRIGNYRGPRSKKPRAENVEIHKWDTYSVDHTLALIIHPLLVQFKKDIEEKELIPSDFFKPVDVSDKTEEEAKEIQEKVFENAKSDWFAILDHMIWSFEQVKDNYKGEDEFFKTREDVEIDDIENRYDIDKDGLNDYYERIDEGLNLFGRYYRSLWW